MKKKISVILLTVVFFCGLAFAGPPASPPSGWLIKGGSTSAQFPAALKSYTVATLPTGNTNDLVLATDCTAADDCSSGSGTHVKILVKTATGWVIIGDGAAAGAGDVGGVGDCTGGDCFDGSSDGGTYLRLYDGNSHYTSVVSSDVSGNVTTTLPATTGTLLNQALASGNVWVGSVGGVATATDSSGWDKDASDDYTSGGTDVALADGGTGASLADPNADRLWGWDDTDGSIAFITIGTGLTYNHATHTLTSSGVGDVTAAAAIDAGTVVIGDDGAKGVKKSAITLDANSNITLGGGAQASQTITGDVSGTDTVLTFGNGVINASTGTLQAGGYAVLTTNTSNLSAANLGAALTFSDGDLINLSGITQSSDTNEGLILPTWANVTTTGVTNGALAWDEITKALKVKSASGWQSIGATAAPVDPTYLTLDANATLTGESVLLAGSNGIDFATAGTAGVDGTVTVNFDPTEVGTSTWGSGSAVTWTFDASAGTDTTVAFGDGTITLSQATVTGTTVANGLVTANAGLTVATGQTTTLSNLAGVLKATAGAVAGGATLDDLAEGSTYQRVAAGDVDANAHVNLVQDSDGTGAVQFTGLSATRAITVDDAAQALAARNRANTFTENNTFGDADTDTLTIRGLVIGGNSRAVWIAGSAPTPTYATGTNELYVAGDIESAGTVYAAGFQSTSAGESYLNLNSNASTPTGAGTNSLYVVSNAWKAKENGTERDLVFPHDSVTWTGATHSFSGVTNFVLPSADADASGEISINPTNNQLVWHDGANVRKIDTTGTITNGYVLKWNSTSGWFEPAADETAGSPTLNSIGSPTADATFTFDAGEEVSFQYTGAFTTGSQFLVQQQTGNPTGGVLFEVRASDSDVTVFKAGDGTNGISLTQAGALTAIGTGSIQATTFTGANGETISNPTDTEIKFGGTESLILDLDTGTANQAQFKSDSGLTELSFAALNLVTTGTISGRIPTVVESTATTHNVTTAQAQAATFFVNTYAGTKTFVLPAAAAGQAVCIKNGQGVAQILRVDTDGTDYVVKSTGARTSAAGDYYGATADAKNQICLVCFDDTDWYVTSEVGTWAEE